MAHAGIIHDIMNDRFHPVLFFANSCTPADPVPGDILPHRSADRHQTGFPSLEEACKHIEENRHMWPTGLVFQWDGKGNPAFTRDLPLGVRVNTDNENKESQNG